MESFVEVGQGPNWGCSAKEKKKKKSARVQVYPHSHDGLVSKMTGYGYRVWDSVLSMDKYVSLHHICRLWVPFIKSVPSALSPLGNVAKA
jgi:hypothetical protein